MWVGVACPLFIQSGLLCKNLLFLSLRMHNHKVGGNPGGRGGKGRVNSSQGTFFYIKQQRRARNPFCSRLANLPRRALGKESGLKALESKTTPTMFFEKHYWGISGVIPLIIYCDSTSCFFYRHCNFCGRTAEDHD